MSTSELLDLEEKTNGLIRLDDARRVVDEIVALDVSWMNDANFATVESVIDKAIQLLSAVPDEANRPLIQRLLIAREGIEQGMSPDPAKRPSIEQMRDFVAERLS